MKTKPQKICYITGLTGTGIIILGSIITAIPYKGTQEESYSFLNHFISELGQMNVSILAPVFNTSLIISGILFAIFMLYLGLYFHKITAYIASTVGIFSGIFLGLVGIFPMNHLAIHVKIAMLFFRSGLAAILLFTLIIIFDKKHKISKWLVIPSIITTLALSCFLVLPKIINPGSAISLLQPKTMRPTLYLNSFLEWLVFITVLIWIVSISIYLIKHKSTPHATKN